MIDGLVQEMLQQVRAGALTRRAFVRTLVGFGLTAPIATHLLDSAGIASAQTPPQAFTPTRRGGGGELKLLWWQGPTLLNPHLASSSKDYDASRIFYEPLAAFGPDGAVVPILAAEVPSLQSGTLAKDGTWVMWRLRTGVTWHDGRPFTADDVVFTWEYAADPATAATTVGSYRDLDRVEKVTDHTVKVVFKKPTPFWSDAFCGETSLILPRHIFGPYRGAKAREAPANLRPVGTGPYRYVDFKPGDIVRAAMNPTYHVPNRPFFDTVEMKGGGDAASAARAVLQTGEYDFAWNMEVEDDLLVRLEQSGKGRIIITPGAAVEHIQCNQTDPLKDVEGERSSLKAPHPFLTDPVVRSALNLLVDRKSIQEQIYGRRAQTTANFLNTPARFHSPNTKWEFNVDKANQMLDAAGWKRGADGVRSKDGKTLRMLFQTSINAPRQKIQAIVKQACGKAGMDVELKSIVASSFFSADPGNTDNLAHFYADLQMYFTSMGRTDPQLYMEQFTSWRIASKKNNWTGRNSTRWHSDEYDRLWKSAENEMDPVKRASLFVRMNDLVIQNVVVIPVVWRNTTSAASQKLRGVDISPWDSNLWNLAYWYEQA
jgi:peptide/nickel transport system substrate-binding protein